MRKWNLLACILATSFCLWLPGVAFSFEGAQCPAILPQSRPFVSRTIASKPGDLFVVLKNGLTLLVHQMPDSRVVSTQVFVHTGSVFEGKYMKAGLSHYLEHLVVSGGTDSMSEDQAKDRLEAIGGSMDAYTSYDRTVFYINAGASHWKGALDILLSKVTQNLIAPKDIAREKNVIQQEMRMRDSSPGIVLWDLLLQTAYRRSPVKYPVVGYPEVFVKEGRKQLLEYYRERYQPQNIIVSVAGNVPAPEVLQFVAQKTRDFLPEASAPATVPREPRQAGPRWEEKEVPITKLVEAMIGFPSVTAYDKDLYALDVLARVMGKGETCRLYCSMKEAQNRVFSIGATNWTPAFVRGQFLISASMSASQWPSALQCIEGQIESLKDTPVSPDELKRAKNAVIAHHLFAEQSVEAEASSLASSFLLTGNPYFDNRYVEGIRAVTAQQVQEVARRYLVKNRMNVAVIKPMAPGEVKPVAAITCPAPKVHKVRFSRMGNGLKLLIKRNANLPIVTLQLWGTGGLALENAKDPGISAFTASLLTAGTKNVDKMDLMKEVEDVGGAIHADSDYNSYHVTIDVLKKNLGLGLRLLADIAQNATFPPDQIEKQKQDTLTAIKMRDQNWQSEVTGLFTRNYFHKTPYAHYKLGTLSSVNSFTRKEILAFYRKMVNPTHSVLAIYGDVEPQQAKELAEREFSKWTGVPVKLSLPDETHPLDANHTVSIRDEKGSSALFIGTNGLGIKDPERPVLDVLTEVLSGGGSLSGRMFDSLRGGSQSLVYTVSTFPFYGDNAGYFGVLTQTTTANLPKVQGIIEQNLEDLTQKLVSPNELDRAREALLTGIKFENETIQSQAGDAALNEVLGLGWNYGERYPALIRAVTPQQIRDLARRLFTNRLVAKTLPENPAKILVAPAAAGSDTP